MAFGHSSLYIFIFLGNLMMGKPFTEDPMKCLDNTSLFGGLTLLVFLICFCCQRKLQARTLAMADITDIEGQQRRQRAARNQRRSDTHELITAIITPPPDYNTVIKKESLASIFEQNENEPGNEPAPPTYEVAMAKLQSDNYV